MLPTLRENSPSSKHLQEHNSTFWWTVACHGMALQLLCGFIAQQFLALAPFSLMVLFIADAALQVAGEVMILLPRDNGACSLCIIKGDDITFPDS
jgi:hypothetical protein